jgi:signal recognition particle receptor subunit beta
MVLFNYSTKELTAKVVYYGPGLCGKTTNLQYIHQNLPDPVRGKMLSLATRTDRTLFFDFLPIDLGSIRGMRTRVQLYTVPGQVFYNETRKLVLKGADGIVFVADSQEQMLGANVESFRNLEDNLRSHAMNLAEIPHVLQFNKRDLPRLSSMEDLNAALNRYNVPFYESVATTGIGVQDTLRAVVKLVLLHLARKYDPATQTTAARVAPVAAAAAPARPSPPPAPVAPRLPGTRRAPAAPGRVIPVSSFETPVSLPRAIPISAVGAAPPPVESRVPPPPPDFRGRGSSEPYDVGPPPTLADSEVETLFDGAGGPEPPAFGPPAEDDHASLPLAAAPDGDLTAFPGEPSVEPAVFEVPPSSARSLTDQEPDLSASISDGLPVASLEVDRGFDPEWSDEPDPSQGLPRQPWAAAPARPAPPAALRERMEPLEPADTVVRRRHQPPSPAVVTPDEAVLLTEVAGDRDLFDDPELEVARLRADEGREIIVPVEIGEGGAVRRFKLTLHLRLDPVD